MAWTPLAERYLYTSLVGVSLAVGILLARAGKYTKKFIFLVGCLVLFFGWQTALRNIVWQNNITLFADVVKKSPLFAPGHNEYGIALLAAGNTKEAKEQFALASKLSCKSRFHPLAAVNLAGFGSSEAFENNIRSNLEHRKLPRRLRIVFLRKLAKNIDYRMLDATDPAERKELFLKAVEVQRKLHVETRNPFNLYREGQLHLALGKKIRQDHVFSGYASTAMITTQSPLVNCTENC
ncbi:MAG: hypothetical protein DRG82_12845 [Deltaproteobacteria bacterium]|nr:MAG: hypothetical protein DRG82_12845 [Deltaproteobacteria bacterium]